MRLRVAALLVVSAAAFACRVVAGDGLSIGTAAMQDDVRVPGFGPRAFGERPTVEEMTALGAKLFADPSLSASGRLSCASCHSPEHAFSAPNRLSAQFGGSDLKAAGH